HPHKPKNRPPPGPRPDTVPRTSLLPRSGEDESRARLTSAQNPEPATRNHLRERALTPASTRAHTASSSPHNNATPPASSGSAARSAPAPPSPARPSPSNHPGSPCPQ